LVVGSFHETDFVVDDDVAKAELGRAGDLESG
jgi:hypothetical protein